MNSIDSSGHVALTLYAFYQIGAIITASYCSYVVISRGYWGSYGGRAQYHYDVSSYSHSSNNTGGTSGSGSSSNTAPTSAAAHSGSTSSTNTSTTPTSAAASGVKTGKASAKAKASSRSKAGENKKNKGRVGKQKGTSKNGDVNIKDLNKLPKNKIKELGGEDYTQRVKKYTGKSKSDLYWDKNGNVYSIPKKDQLSKVNR